MILPRCPSHNQTWSMAFDPAKFNVSSTLGTKQAFQCQAAKQLGWVDPSTNCTSYDVNSAPAYAPDITNPQYQDLLVSWAEKQIDLGADGIWIDMLFWQASALAQATGNPNSSAVRMSFYAASNVIDRIHAYGRSKGKYIYVGTEWNFVNLTYSAPAVDFVTASPTAAEVKGPLNSTRWGSIKSQVMKMCGNIPIMANLDWGGAGGGTGSALTTFSQYLTPDQQRAWLASADAFFRANGIIFAYPVHGGTFPSTSGTLAFGKYNTYDSLAPQFATYNTIVSLATKKSGS